VLARDPGRVAAVLGESGVVDHERQGRDLGHDALRAGAHDGLGLPGRVGQKLLQRLVLGRARAEPQERRLEALSAAVLHEPASAAGGWWGYGPWRAWRGAPVGSGQSAVALS